METALSSMSNTTRRHVKPKSMCDIKLKPAVKVKYPKRAPSIVIPERKPVFITADKTTCAECPCFPKDSPYMKPPKLRQCQQSPLTLYELAAKVVDSIPLPAALSWSENEVVTWMVEVVGLPEYKECIVKNHISGMRLIQFEDPKILSLLNIHIYDHVQTIITEIKKLYSLDFFNFLRSIGLPPRKPLSHCTWFKSRTGPSWGIRQNWTRCYLLRWMKIIGPAPVHRDHWDIVWYKKTDFPKTMFARIPPAASRDKIPMYGAPEEPCDEYMVPRKFRLDRTNPDEEQLIWMQRTSWSKLNLASPPVTKKNGKKMRRTLVPEKVCLKGLVGKELLLARRLMPKPKFLN